MNQNLRNLINGIDARMGNFGFSQNSKANYGMVNTEAGPMLVDMNTGAATPVANVDPGLMAAVVPSLAPIGANKTNYSINKAIASAEGSTFMVNVKCAKTGTGSGNTKNPVFLFGSDAWAGMSKPYSSVQNAGQVVSTSFVDGKNVIIFKYATDADNYTTYTVTLTTKGDYIFILNKLTGGKSKFEVQGLQINVSDVDYASALTKGLQKFWLDAFGAADSNDLLTPQDLYQQQTNGVYIPHKYPISGSDGLIFQAQEVNNLEWDFYFTVQ